jgi:hypothetical protein
MYQYKDQKADLEILRQAGFNRFQMDRLVKFRRKFVLGEMDQTPTDYRRLEFARWLFLSGKLNDIGEQ